MRHSQYNSGYTLVEMIIYVALLAIISVLMVSTLISFTKSYRTLAALRITDDTAISAMERMTRDARAATAIDSVHSLFGTASGILTLIASSSVNTATTTKFYLQNGLVKMDVNGAYYGPLTASNASTTALTFTKLSTSISGAIKIDMTVSATVGTSTKIKTYHDTIILK